MIRARTSVAGADPAREARPSARRTALGAAVLFRWLLACALLVSAVLKWMPGTSAPTEALEPILILASIVEAAVAVQLARGGSAFVCGVALQGIGVGGIAYGLAVGAAGFAGQGGCGCLGPVTLTYFEHLALCCGLIVAGVVTWGLPSSEPERGAASAGTLDETTGGSE